MYECPVTDWLTRRGLYLHKITILSKENRLNLCTTITVIIFPFFAVLTFTQFTKYESRTVGNTFWFFSFLNFFTPRRNLQAAGLLPWRPGKNRRFYRENPTCLPKIIRVQKFLRRHRRASECQQTHQPERSCNCSAPFIV